MDSNHSRNEYTPEELAAATALLQIYQAPIDFNQSTWTPDAVTENNVLVDYNRSQTGDTPEELGAATALLEIQSNPVEIGSSSMDVEASNMNEVHAGDNAMADAPTDSAVPLTTAQPPTLPNTEQSPKTWFHDLLDRVPLKKFVRFGLRTPQLNAEGEHRIEAVLVAMPERSCVQEAAWYLEENNWVVRKAIAQYQQDEAARANQNSAEYQQALQAAKSVTKQSFTRDLLEFRIQEATGTRRYNFPGAEDFNIDNPNHLRALNHWRADLTRMRGPLPTIPAPTGADKYWKPGEERFLQYRYAHRKDDYAVGGTPDMAKLVGELNLVTVGRYMPGKLVPCAGRTVTSANAWIDRTWKKDNQGNRILFQQRYNSSLNILRKREEEEAEYDRLVS